MDGGEGDNDEAVGTMYIGQVEDVGAVVLEVDAVPLDGEQGVANEGVEEDGVVAPYLEMENLDAVASKGRDPRYGVANHIVVIGHASMGKGQAVLHHGFVDVI